METTEALDNLRHEMRTERIPEDRLVKMDLGVDKIREQALEDRSLQIGAKVPDFSLPDSNGDCIRLYEFLKNGPVILVFYRGSWCPYCNIHLRGMQKALPKLRAMGAELIAISPQLPVHTEKSVETNSLTFPVLSDVGNRVSADFGTVFTSPTELNEALREFGVDLTSIHGPGEADRLPVPSTYVIDGQGLVVWRHFEVDYTHRAEPEEVLRVIEGL